MKTNTEGRIEKKRTQDKMVIYFFCYPLPLEDN